MTTKDPTGYIVSVLAVLTIGLVSLAFGGRPEVRAAQDKSSIPSEPQQEVELQLLEEQILDVLDRDDRLAAAIKKMIADEAKRTQCDCECSCHKTKKASRGIYEDEWFESRSPSLQTALLELMPPDSPERIRRESRP